MQQEQTKTLLTNIITAVVVVAVVATGYSVFTKNEPIVPNITVSSSTETVAQATALIGAEIADTVTNLEKLHTAVEDAVTVFEMFSFKNLKDLSVGVPNQKVGRENPFVPTEWKLKIIAIEEAIKKSASQGASGQATSPTSPDEIQTIIQSQMQGQESLSSDIDPNAL